MSNINELVLLEITNLASFPAKSQRDPKAPWNILNVNGNYNPHLQVRPLSTQVHKLQVATNLAQNTNKQPINQRTPRNINVLSTRNLLPHSQLPNTNVKSLYSQAGGSNLPPSQKYAGWKYMSPMNIK